ncbi:ranBP-type and C3HC4-type zinc finger-containing protein 1-like [Uranotaenia lowii]|uniref:ranBP-type and C3HC4-type zinc finger-containing protein 1-like n=1 Tax=Uranotaenia lowii TaxID=190385 RepID=UPI00247AAFF8|nr:ranBP-type and C3HC4-type zinc finger-containing protein 1-like [Uranotaenia lowii]
MHRGQQMDDDSKSLFDYGLQDTQDIVQLYIVSNDQQPIVCETRMKNIPAGKNEKQPHFSPIEAKILSVSDSDEESSDTQNEKLEADESNLGATALATIPEDSATRNEETEGWPCPLCTLINPPNRPGCGACSESRPASYIVPTKYQTVDDNFIPEEVKRFIINDLKRPTEPTPVQLRNLPKESRNDLNRVSSNRKSSDLFNIMLDEAKAGLPEHGASQQPCTTSDLLTTRHIQVPEQKNIVLTAFTSPNITRNKYRGVDNFNPNSYGNGPTTQQKSDGPVISTASPIVRAILLKGSTEKPVKFGRNGLAIPENGIETSNHYSELVNLDAADLIANVDPFDCPICFGHFKQYEGIVLRDCLHSFCKECLVNTINYCEEAEIKCPYMDNSYSCESIVQQREIKALVSKDMYEAYLAKSIRQAESKLDNTFHCKTPNCRGWCIYEDNVNQFKCPVCTIVNCLTCRAIHDGLDCKQYQDRMNSDCDTNIDAKRTKDMLQQMVDKGDALYCPTCQVVMMKKWGCDWLKCSMCKTEICWVTRGPRWGPGGKGDTSGGCRCGVDGKKCHPECNYCH